MQCPKYNFHHVSILVVVCFVPYLRMRLSAYFSEYKAYFPLGIIVIIWTHITKTSSHIILATDFLKRYGHSIHYFNICIWRIELRTVKLLTYRVVERIELWITNAWLMSSMDRLEQVSWKLKSRREKVDSRFRLASDNDHENIQPVQKLIWGQMARER